jgi:predicted ester cyclase
MKQAAGNAALAEPWANLWNGDLAVAQTLLSDELVTHKASDVGGATTDTLGRGSLIGWIEGIHSLFSTLNFTIDVGPICDDQHMVVRWQAKGTYTGGLPGSSPDALGRQITFYGTDILRVADGRLAEYWATADGLGFMQQLGVTQIPLLP